MTQRAVIGIDIGGTKTLCALFDDDFRIVEEIKIKTHAHKGEEAFTASFLESVGSLVEAAARKRLSVTAVGVGCAGCADPDKGTMRSCPNVGFLQGYPLRKRLRKITGASVWVANDVQAGLYGEHQLGAAAGLKHVIGIFVGTGIGGALIIDGKLHVGATGYAGDIGNYLLHTIGPLGGWQREGVLDDVASRTAIAGDAAVLAAKRLAPHLQANAGTDVAKIRSGDLADAIENGDKAIDELVRSRARILGVALSNIVDFINPEMVVLGGGLVDAMPDLMVEEIATGIENHVSPAAKKLKVVAAALKDHAVTVGAAKLALDCGRKK